MTLCFKQTCEGNRGQAQPWAANFRGLDERGRAADVTLETGLMRAYHRHMQEFCGPFPDRLKGPIVTLYVFFLDYYVSGLTAGAVKS